MIRTIAVSAALGLFCVASLGAPAAAPQAAACVAALKAREARLAETLKAGAPVGSELLKVVRSGIAIIGTQYLAGLREGEARLLLKNAEREFEALPPATAGARQAACLREGQSLYEGASGFERSLITSAARRRIQRITGGA